MLACTYVQAFGAGRATLVLPCHFSSTTDVLPRRRQRFHCIAYELVRLCIIDCHARRTQQSRHCRSAIRRGRPGAVTQLHPPQPPVGRRRCCNRLAAIDICYRAR